MPLGQKGDADLQAAKRDCNASPTCDTTHRLKRCGPLWALEWTWYTFLGRPIGIDRTKILIQKFVLA